MSWRCGTSYLLRKQATTTGDPAKWHEVLAAVNRAVDLIGPLGDASLSRVALALQKEVAAAAETADRDAALLRTVLNIRAAQGQRSSMASAGDAAYAKAFRDAAIDIDALGPDAAGAKIRDASPGEVPVIAAALDDWSSRRRKARPKDTESLAC